MPFDAHREEVVFSVDVPEVAEVRAVELLHYVVLRGVEEVAFRGVGLVFG